MVPAVPGLGRYKTGVERLVKETVSKTAKDALNKSIGTLAFQKLYGTVPALYEQAAGQISGLANPSVEEIKEIQAAVDAKAHSSRPWAGAT